MGDKSRERHEAQFDTRRLRGTLPQSRVRRTAILAIDAINKIIRAAGQIQVNAVTDQNAAIAVGVLAREQRRILATGFPFNTDTITIQVNTADRVPVSNEYLRIRFRDSDGHLDTRKDAGTRYVWNLDENDFHDEDTEVQVTFNFTSFADIPEKFAQWIAAEAAFRHWQDVNPSGVVNRYLLEERNLANAEAVNSLAPDSMNVLKATGWNRLRRIQGVPVSHFNGRWIGLD